MKKNNKYKVYSLKQLNLFSKQRKLKVRQGAKWYWANKKIKVIQRLGTFSAQKFLLNTRFFFLITNKKFIFTQNRSSGLLGYTNRSVFVGDHFFIAELSRSFFTGKPYHYKLNYQKGPFSNKLYLDFVTTININSLFYMDLFFVFLEKIQGVGFKSKKNFLSFKGVPARKLKSFLVYTSPRIFFLFKKEIYKCLFFLKRFLIKSKLVPRPLLVINNSGVGKGLYSWFKNRADGYKISLDLYFCFFFFFFSLLQLRNKEIKIIKKNTIFEKSKRNKQNKLK